MPALLEAVADLEVEELEVMPVVETTTPKRVLETVVIGPDGLEAPSIAADPAIAASSCNTCLNLCCCTHNGCFY